MSEVRHTLWGAGSQRPVCICSPCGVPLAPPPTPRTAVRSGRSAGRRQAGLGTHSRNLVMYSRLQRDQVRGMESYRSCGDMTKGRFPTGSQSLPLPSC